MSVSLPIAFVEDDASFSRAVARFLRVAGHQVRTFASAEEFLDSPPVSYGCLIFDFQLPGLSGLELFQQISATVPQLSAIFISAQDESGIREKIAQLPGCAFLRKPFVVAELLEAVTAQFSRFSAFHQTTLPPDQTFSNDSNQQKS